MLKEAPEVGWWQLDAAVQEGWRVDRKVARTAALPFAVTWSAEKSPSSAFSRHSYSCLEDELSFVRRDRMCR